MRRTSKVGSAARSEVADFFFRRRLSWESMELGGGGRRWGCLFVVRGL